VNASALLATAPLSPTRPYRNRTSHLPSLVAHLVAGASRRLPVALRATLFATPSHALFAPYRALTGARHRTTGV